MRCPNCAEEIRETAKVCGYCGTRLNPPLAAVPDPESSIGVPIDVPEPGPEPESEPEREPETEPEPEPEPESEGVSESERERSVPAVPVAASGGRSRRLLWPLVAVFVIVTVAVGIAVSGGDDSTADTAATASTVTTDGEVPAATAATSPVGSTVATHSVGDILGSYERTDVDGSTIYVFIEMDEDGLLYLTVFDDGTSACGEETMPPALLGTIARFDGSRLFSGGEQLRWNCWIGGSMVPMDWELGQLEFEVVHGPDGVILYETAVGVSYLPSAATIDLIDEVLGL